MNTSNHIGVQHAGKVDVIDEHSLPYQQFIVFCALNWCADESHRPTLRFPVRSSLRDHTTGSLDDGVDDILIARTAAEMTRNGFSHLCFVERAALAQQRSRSHEKSGSAKPALESVMSLESLLQRVKGVIFSQTFHCCELGLVRLHCKHQARPHRLAVIEHRAAPTHTMLATDVGAS